MADSAQGPAPAVVITGASTGIGQACALELDRLGFHVFAGVRRAADAVRLAEQAAGRLVPLMIDVTDLDSIAEAARTVAAAVGGAGLAGLVNNAGIAVGGPLEHVPLDELRRQLEVNVVGQLAVIQAFLPPLRSARGRIILISSFNGRIAVPYQGPYAASKHALEAIGDVLRIELRRSGIAVSVIEPGSVRTPIWDKVDAQADQAIQNMTPQTEMLYGDDMRAMRSALAALGQKGMPVERVVRAVLHALTAPRPKTRYPLGTQTRLAFFAFKLLPDRLGDWLLCRYLGLK